MPAYLTTGSAVERSLICGASVALPHAYYESPHTIRGSVIHAFLEACSTIGREAALDQVPRTPDDYREVCDAIDLTGLHDALSLAAEVAIAYDVETDTARELGRGAGRAYDDVGENEIPCTLDVIGTRDVAEGRRGIYVEWKSGFTTRRHIDRVLQINFGALAISRCYGCDFVEGQLVHVHEDMTPYVQRTLFEAWELDGFASELREHHARWKKLRADWRANVPILEYQTGDWCDRCPAREFCDAQTTMVRRLITGDETAAVLRAERIPEEAIAKLWRDVHVAQSALSSVKEKIRGIASTRRIFLGKDPDGKDRWLGQVISDGVERLDGESVFDVVAELYGESVATAATKISATKEDLGDAIRNAVPRGKKAAAVRDVLDRLRKTPGAVTRKQSVSVREFAVKPDDGSTHGEIGPAPAELPPEDDRPPPTDE